METLLLILTQLLASCSVDGPSDQCCAPYSVGDGDPDLWDFPVPPLSWRPEGMVKATPVEFKPILKID